MRVILDRCRLLCNYLQLKFAWKDFPLTTHNLNFGRLFSLPVAGKWLAGRHFKSNSVGLNSVALSAFDMDDSLTVTYIHSYNCPSTVFN